MRRLKRWDTRARIYASVERNLSQAMAELDRLADKLHIPKAVKEEAALIYRKALSEGLVRGRSIAAIAAASIYAACRITRTPKTLREIVEASLRSEREISRSYRIIIQELKTKLPIDDPVKYVSKIASKVNIGQKVQNEAVGILREARRRGIAAGKGPVGLAAAALYVATLLQGKEITQRELAEASGVTEVTIRNRYKGLKRGLTDILQLAVH
jgi:transcription initiation factor TFIIB